MEDAFAQRHRDETLELRECDPATGETREDPVLTPERRSFSYVLKATNNEGEELLSRLGTPDVHLLCQHCFQVIQAYVDFYMQQIGGLERHN